MLAAAEQAGVTHLMGNQFRWQPDRAIVVVEHDMRAITQVDWVIDLGPGAGEDGGRIIASGVPRDVAEAKGSLTAPYLKAAL